MEPRWLTARSVLAMHDIQLARHGGQPGMRDAALFESAMQRPCQLLAYGSDMTLFRLAAAYAFGIARNHPFVDGNKRTAFLAAVLFLGKNGYTLKAPEPRVVTSMLLLAAGEWTEEQYAEWLERNSAPTPPPAPKPARE